MPIPIDRILETMFRRSVDVCWLNAGLPPKLWVENRERELQMPALKDSDLVWLIQNLVSDSGLPELESKGRWHQESNYGTVMRFGLHVARADASYVIALRRVGPAIE